MTNEQVLLLAIPKREGKALFFQPDQAWAYRYAIVLNASMFSQQSGKIRPSELCLRSAINYASDQNTV